MTRNMLWMGFWATLLIVAALTTAVLREPKRQAEAAAIQQAEAITEGTLLFAENCVICHGAAGEGLAAFPMLNSDGIRDMDETALFNTITRGRYNTAMAAYSVAEGGIFTDAQIDSLVTLLQVGDWTQVAAQVDALGLTPPEPIVVDIPEEALTAINSLPDGEALADGLTVFAENCVACHGSNGEGTSLAPALNTPDLHIRYTGDDLTRIITQGVSGTLMAGWEQALTPTEISDVMLLLNRWDVLESAGIALPTPEAVVLDMSPEAVAEGSRLYSLLCVQCHGVEGFGTRMAPALNNSIFLSETPDAAIQQIIAQGVPGTAMPAWGGRLDESEIAVLTAFLRSHEATAPAIVAPSAG